MSDKLPGYIICDCDKYAWIYSAEVMRKLKPGWAVEWRVIRAGETLREGRAA